MELNLKKNFLLFKENFGKIISFSIDKIFNDLTKNKNLEKIKKNYSKMKIINNNVLKISEKSEELKYDSAYDSIFSTNFIVEEDFRKALQMKKKEVNNKLKVKIPIIKKNKINWIKKKKEKKFLNKSKISKKN